MSCNGARDGAISKKWKPHGTGIYQCQINRAGPVVVDVLLLN